MSGTPVYDSWTCPKCPAKTTVIAGSVDAAVALAAVREHHRCEHRPHPATQPMKAVGARARPIPPIPDRRRTEP